MHQQNYNSYLNQDASGGSFEMWHPSMGSQSTSTTSVGTNNFSNNSGSRWQVNRDNAIDEAYRSISNMSLNNSAISSVNSYLPSSNEMSQVSQSLHAISQFNPLTSLNMQQTQPAATQQYYNEPITGQSTVPSLSSYQPLAAHNSPAFSSMQSHSVPWSASTVPNSNFQKETYGASSMYSSNSQPYASTSEIYKNPLDAGNDKEDAANDSAEVLIARMKESAAKQQMQTRNFQNQPLLSKAALAQVTHDLNEAAAPFQTVETLKEFRNKQLGFSPTSNADSSPDSSSKSSLSVYAVEFIPRSKMSNVKGSFLSREKEKPNLSKELEVDLMAKNVEMQFLSRVKKQERCSRFRKAVEIASPTADITLQNWQQRPAARDIFEPDVCWNPLDGPVFSKTPRKADKSVEKTLHRCGASSNGPRKSSEPVCSGKNDRSDSVAFDHLKIKASKLPFHISSDNICFVPIPGLASLNDLGFHSDVEVREAVKSKVSQTHDLPNIPREDEIESIQEVSAITITDMYVNELIVNPACYGETVDDFVKELISYNLTDSAVSVIVDKIYEMCVMERNFRYLGSQLCDKLSRFDSGLPGFRSALLTKAQKEFQAMDADVTKSDQHAQRARNFTQFMAELFLNLLVEGNDSRSRIVVLGRGVFGVVRMLIDHPSDDNLQCAVRVLKLTMTALEDSLKDDGKNSIEKLHRILDDLEAIHNKSKFADHQFKELTLSLLSSLVQLRKNNWGRESNSSSAAESRLQPPDILSQQDENYFMNEPVFFTPGGKLYTAADAADPEFFEKHLAPYSVNCGNSQADSDGSKSHQQSSSSPNYQHNPLNGPSSTAAETPYPVWSSGDANRSSPPFEEDDYDADYEAFLRSTGQLS